MTQMKFHRLLSHQQARPNLRIRQSLDATQRHLRLAPAQVFVVDNSLDNSLKRTIARTILNSLRIRFHPALFTPRNDFIMLEDPIGGSVIARSIAVGFDFALNTKLRYSPSRPRLIVLRLMIPVSAISARTVKTSWRGSGCMVR